ncbi:hypothetical protein CsatB_026164 [Cannabis sativa]
MTITRSGSKCPSHAQKISKNPKKSPSKSFKGDPKMGLKGIAKKGMTDVAESSGSKKRPFPAKVEAHKAKTNLQNLLRMFSPILTSRMKFLIWNQSLKLNPRFVLPKSTNKFENFNIPKKNSPKVCILFLFFC